MFYIIQTQVCSFLVGLNSGFYFDSHKSKALYAAPIVLSYLVFWAHEIFVIFTELSKADETIQIGKEMSSWL